VNSPPRWRAFAIRRIEIATRLFADANERSPPRMIVPEYINAVDAGLQGRRRKGKCNSGRIAPQRNSLGRGHCKNMASRVTEARSDSDFRHLRLSLPQRIHIDKRIMPRKLTQIWWHRVSRSLREACDGTAAQELRYRQYRGCESPFASELID
jgi:hypothetical protein